MKRESGAQITVSSRQPRPSENRIITIRVCVCVCVCVCSCARVLVCVLVCSCVYVCMYISMCVYVYVWCICNVCGSSTYYDNGYGLDASLSPTNSCGKLCAASTMRH